MFLFVEVVFSIKVPNLSGRSFSYQSVCKEDPAHKGRDMPSDMCRSRSNVSGRAVIDTNGTTGPSPTHYFRLLRASSQAGTGNTSVTKDEVLVL